MNSFSSSVIIGISLAVVGVGALVVPVPESGFTQAAQVNGRQIRTGVNTVGTGVRDVGRGIRSVVSNSARFVGNRVGAVVRTVTGTGTRSDAIGPSRGFESPSGNLPVVNVINNGVRRDGVPAGTNVITDQTPTTDPRIPAQGTPAQGSGPVLPHGRTTPLGTEQQLGSQLELIQYMGIQQRQVPIER